MRKRRLLTASREHGSVVVESVFAIFVLLLLALGTIQVTLSLYARNVVMAAVHDGARSAIEIGGSEADATAVAGSVIERSAGSLVDDLNIAVATEVVSDRHHVRVTATGSLDVSGPVPITIPITVVASASREVIDAPGR